MTVNAIGVSETAQKSNTTNYAIGGAAAGLVVGALAKKKVSAESLLNLDNDKFSIWLLMMN